MAISGLVEAYLVTGVTLPHIATEQPLPDATLTGQVMHLDEQILHGVVSLDNTVI